MYGNASMSKKFKPWRAEFYYSALYAAASVGVLILSAQAFTESMPRAFFGACVAAGLAGLSRLAWSDGQARWYGASLERWGVARCRPQLERLGFSVGAGVRVVGLGDADLVVTNPKNNVSCVVEIKAFEIPDDRVLAAAEQARRVGDRLRAEHAVVWLPRGRRNWRDWFGTSCRAGVPVVKGDSRKLVRFVRQKLK